MAEAHRQRLPSGAEQFADDGELTGGKGVPVVYDSVGRNTFHQSLDCVARRGLVVCFGTASGAVPPIDAMQLATKGSVFVTRPALADYIAGPVERAALAGELFGHVEAGRIKIKINQRVRLERSRACPRDLEAGLTYKVSVSRLLSPFSVPGRQFRASCRRGSWHFPG